MAAPGTSPVSVILDGECDTRDTDSLLAGILQANGEVSDLIFSPGRLPQVEIHGQLLTVQGPTVHVLTPDDTRRIASDLIGNNKQAITILRGEGSCDISYGLPGIARFRVNAFIQRGSCAVVMRVISTTVPTLSFLGLPRELGTIADADDGIVLIAGLRGSGKSTTLAALIDHINQHRVCHLITIEDPIEFLHNHKRATIHQRELHSDTPNVALALRAAMRQSPDVIVVSELHNRETIEGVLDAAATGHLVLSTVNAPDVEKAIERILSVFPASDQDVVRGRLARTLRCVVSQKLIPKQDARGRTPVVEIVRPHLTQQ